MSYRNNVEITSYFNKSNLNVKFYRSYLNTTRYHCFCLVIEFFLVSVKTEHDGQIDIDIPRTIRLPSPS